LPIHQSYVDFINENRNITISVYVNVDNMTAKIGNRSRLGYEMSIVYEDDSMSHLGVWQELDIGESFNGRISKTFTISKKVKRVHANGMHIQLEADSHEVARPKLEKGTKATDWTPAPEDVDSRIDHAETEIKHNADEIALRATKDEVDKERVKINKAQADITANADAIKLRATTTQLNTEKKRSEEHTSELQSRFDL